MCDIMGRNIFLLLLVFRIITVFLVQTFFVPDEYWQSLEVAHYLSYGYGYLTWEWKKEIRSCTYPMFIAIIYNIFPSSKFVLTMIPRLFQALLSTCGDYFTLKLATKIYGSSVRKWTLLCILSSWFLFYCSTRTITNMAESSFTAIGLYFYPWKIQEKQRNTWVYLIPLGFSMMMRPTSAVLWLLLYVWHLLQSQQSMWFLVKRTFLTGVSFLCALMLIDYGCYGHWVITPFRFFSFNWSHNIGAFYGTNPWHWYFSIGFPAVMGAHIIPFLLGALQKRTRLMVYLIFYFLEVFSLLSHKEFRFLLPVLPICMCICGAGLDKLSSSRMRLGNMVLGSQLSYACSILMVVTNAIIGLYVGLIHQRGVMDSVSYLSTVVRNDSSVVFLMPCHSTPYYSHIHHNITMKFLTCEPNFSSRVGYIDEADQFYDNPSLWLQSYFLLHAGEMPSHIVLFDVLLETIYSVMRDNYELCFSASHADFSQGRVGKKVYVFCKK